MTLRAFILGMLVAVGLGALGYLNDSQLRLTFLVGNHLPISVFGFLILTVFCFNPLLRLVGTSLQLRSAELAVIFTFMLVAASIPGSGLMRTLTPSLVMPHEINKRDTGWRKANVMSYVPPQMLPGGTTYDEEVMEGFLNGGREVSLNSVPWQKWRDPLMVWLPLIILTSVGGICMSLVVHRQWAYNERLRYPIADFATTLLEQDPASGNTPILRNKLFWGGLATVLFIRILNGIHAWDNESISIPLTFSFDAVVQKWPSFGQIPFSGFVTSPTFFPTVIAFAFFLASDVGFSLGMLQFFTVASLGILLGLGVNISTGYISHGPQTWHLFGSYLAMGLVILWVGRHYYFSVAKQSLTFIPQKGVDSTAPWAMRMLVLAVATMCGILIYLGLDWTLAVMTVGLIMLLFLVMGRVNVESGLIFVQARWQAMGVLIGLLGVHALGPKAIAIIGLLCMVLTIDPRECLMPFVLNGLKISDQMGVKPNRLRLSLPIIYIVCILAAVTVVLVANYSKGVPRWDGWATNHVPSFGLSETKTAVEQLNIVKQLASSEALSPIQRITHMVPDSRFLWFTGSGFLLVMVTSFLRLRFTWWPLHPVLFLVWWTFPAMAFSGSILAGWLIKTAVTRFGGGQKYRQLKPLMIGIIAGDLLGGLLFMGIGAAYYAITGMEPKEYRIFPG